MIEINDTVAALLESLKNANDKQRSAIVNKLSLDYNNAIPMLWSKIITDEDPRAILSVMRDILKKEKPKGMFKRTIGNSKEKLSALLSHSDPKVRKNVCGVIGELGDPAYLEALYNAYNSEDKLFVRYSYVLAIGNCGTVDDAVKLRKMFEDVVTNEKACSENDSLIETSKHINEEKLALTRAIDKLSPPVHHEFKGFDETVPMILTVMNYQYQQTLKELEENSINGRLIDEGILIYEDDLDKIYKCRTFYELLFPLDKCEDLQFDYKIIASEIINANIVDFLNQCHDNESNLPFGYRVEFKTMDASRERSEFVKNLSMELDSLSSGNLKNSPSSYEVEIRILEKNDLCSVFIKLYSYVDNRFDYRKNEIATSINPITAAIVMKSIEKWLKTSANVIDPFCGTGTMLIERAKLKAVGSLTGIDIYRRAISAAEVNSKLANLDIDLIDEDIFEFYTSHPFDELITNMPFDNKSTTHNKYADLYRDFVNKIPSLVIKGGMAFVYTIEKQLFREVLIDNEDLELLQEIKIESGRLTPHVFVLRVK
ncbi:HEAT repeat domain-containing protein [Clostridium bowmanii]|uniref:HEAT repeat domain-containing protein n=1 Tax=Clostridium bowmanii TaxID=132925 RepID=UPI001C0AE4E0|nr:HEAT repeat domain-containing protein [Clostridium bowmanii]MBU3190526.1 HEAT repeat domain-containing protein [Clostridium bowmanii]MCA1074412.1 HEAT repeat domain-containing protein [Clostridium bowmanii]